MAAKDFEGIQKFKIMILAIVLFIISASIIGPIFYFQNFQKVFIFVQGAYMLKVFYYIIMTSIASYQALKILRRVEKKENQVFWPQKKIYHSIVIPIYDQNIELLRVTLEKLAIHSRAKSQYCVFLALQYHSQKPIEKGQLLKEQFKGSFKLMEYTIHELQPEQCRGKASNENWCLVRMQPILLVNNIDPKEVMFTTIDADNWAPEAYFSEVELHLSKHQWRMDNFMFAPNQMFTINNKEVPIFNRTMDFFMGSAIFAWSNNLTRVQTAASNYSLSFTVLKQIGFLDTNANAMCDDFHTSLKALWKKQGQLQIVPIYVMFNLTNLETGKGYLSNLNARFWQAERHMRGLLDAAYNFNMLTKSPLRLRTLWMTFAYLEHHLVALILYFTAFGFFFYKLTYGIELTPIQSAIVRTEAITMPIIAFLYYWVTSKSSEILYGLKRESILRWFEFIVLHKVLVLFFAIIPQIIAVFRTFHNPTFDTSLKHIKLSVQKSS